MKNSVGDIINWFSDVTAQAETSPIIFMGYGHSSCLAGVWLLRSDGAIVLHYELGPPRE